MNETLQDRLQREAREKLNKKYDVRYFDGSTYAVIEEHDIDFNEIISHTISETIKAVNNEGVEPDKVFDCFEDACEECTVCKYLNFREWAEGCAPMGSTIERNELVEDYLKRKDEERNQIISETLKAGVSVIEGEKKEDYCYDEKNEAHNDFEESLDYLETKGEAHEEGFNQALQTAVTKLQELIKK